MRRRLQFAVAHAANQIFDAVSDCSQPLQADLSRRTFYSVNCPEKFINFFRIVVAFERQQAIADNLEMLFRFRLEEFQNLRRHLVVERQRVKI